MFAYDEFDVIGFDLYKIVMLVMFFDELDERCRILAINGSFGETKNHVETSVETRSCHGWQRNAWNGGESKLMYNCIGDDHVLKRLERFEGQKGEQSNCRLLLTLHQAESR